MRQACSTALVAFLVACSGTTGGSSDRDGGGSMVGESCIRSSDCAEGLACVNLTCTPFHPDGGNEDGSRRGTIGDSCVRTIDCAEPLRCVSMRCAVGDDAGLPGDGGISSSSGGSGDGGARAEGCENPGPAPRGLGGCCAYDSECSSSLCIAGTCSQPCTTGDTCEVNAAATPFSSSTAFTCGAWPSSSTGRACLPGSLQACVPGGCPANEACVPIATGDADGGVVVTLRCTARRVGKARMGGGCAVSSDCEDFSPIADNCAQGVCRNACSEGAACAAGEECKPAVESGPGICQGVLCGQGAAGADILCPEGQVCIPSVVGEGPQWLAQCTPRDPTGMPAGSPCTDDTRDACIHHLCVDDHCSRLCRTDDDCPPALPFCVEDTASNGIFVAACRAVPPTAQLCLDEESCGALGCRYLGERTEFSWCAAGGTSHVEDPMCGVNRYCRDDALCLPDDVDGTPRCAKRAKVGAPCDDGNDCLSGSCVDREGGQSPSSLCSSRCRTAEDCGSGMECRTIVASESPLGRIYHSLCWPLGPVDERCTESSQCTERMRGNHCDGATGACFTLEAAVGHACSVDTDCSLGLRCGTPAGQQGLCVRDGCIPEMSGAGCTGDEVCIRTSDVTAECRRACTTSGDCRVSNSELVCVTPASLGGPSWCGLP